MMCPHCGNKMRRSTVGLYHYRESGLDNVYLRNVGVHKFECGGKLIQVHAIQRLHDAIAYHLLKKHALLAGPEFRFLRQWVGLTAKRLASALGVKTRISISRWENGKAPITPATDHAMRLLVMRLKEETVHQRMFGEVGIQEQFERISTKPGRPSRITISQETLENLPFPSLPVAG